MFPSYCLRLLENSMWMIYVCRVLLSRWALTHPQPEVKEGTQKIIIKTPDFLDMVPWYSGYVTFTCPALHLF